MKSQLLIIVSFLLLGNNLLFTYADHIFGGEKVCTMDEKSCCVMNGDKMDDCCGMDDCCMNIPAPGHFSFGVIIGTGAEHNETALRSNISNETIVGTDSFFALSDGFLTKLYKPPLTLAV